MPYYENLIVTGSLSVTDGSREFKQPTGFIFDLSGQTLTMVAVPEPAVLTLAGLGGVVAAAWCRRCRRRAFGGPGGQSAAGQE